mmetsp:Transcript_95344/g.179258  ORF Transcript_95344/g.179258 Transcript_95344/m.179258 type:complete len:387 (-) Transcript_95344:89-1249(-)
MLFDARGPEAHLRESGSMEGSSSSASDSCSFRPKLAGNLETLLRRHYSAGDLDDNPPSEILDGFLYLGDVENACSRSQLREYGITRILSVTTSPELGQHEDVKRIFLYIRDAEDEDISVLFSPACDFIKQAKQDKERVLVHCMAGRSRSATLVLAFLMRHEHMTLHDAFILAKQRRSIVFPNVGFWKLLMEEEHKRFGQNSQTPSAYKVALQISAGELKLSPNLLLKRYIAAASLSDETYSTDAKKRAVEEWPSGWSAAKCVVELFLASIENLKSTARTSAVEFISELLARGCFTRAEVLEGFSILQDMDLDDLRIDNPKVDEYVAEMIVQAEVQGLLKGSQEDMGATVSDETSADQSPASTMSEFESPDVKSTSSACKDALPESN